MALSGPWASHLDGFYDVAAQLQRRVYRRTEELLTTGHRTNDDLLTIEDVRARQQQIHLAAIEALGGLPDRGEVPTIQTVGKVTTDGYAIEKITFESLPGVTVTGNVYVPSSLTEATGAVLFCCGHLNPGKAALPYQAACARLARNGLIVLITDSIGQGERKSYLDANGNEQILCNTVEHNYAGVQCWWVGDSIARYFIHDARRAIDYLATRDDVDANRIGVVGHSGGATLISWLMMTEPRLAAAAPGCFVTDRSSILHTGKAQDAEQIMPAAAWRGMDHEDFLIAMAPRPTMVLSANYDYFPIEGTVRTVERARRVYRIFNAEDHLKHVRVNGPHGFPPGMARAAAEFMVQHLGNNPQATINHEEPMTVAEEELWCTSNGQVLLDSPDARRVFDLNLERHHDLAMQHGHNRAEKKTQTARGWLADRVYTHRCLPSEFYPRWLPTSRLGGTNGLRMQRAFWWAETDLLNAGVLVRPGSGEYRTLVIALFDHGTSEFEGHRDWLVNEAIQQHAVFAVDVRGAGVLSPRPINPRPDELHYGTMYKLNTDLLWLDDSLAAARVFDLLRAVEFARTDPEIDLGNRPIALYGEGMGAFHCYLAAAMEPAIARVELANPPLNPTELVTTRYYKGEREWQLVIRGMATHCPLDSLLPLFKDRELVIADSKVGS